MTAFGREFCSQMMRKLLVLSVLVVAASATSFPAASTSATCYTFLHDLNLQCPLSIPFSSSPILVDGRIFEETLNSTKNNEFIAILFYASWCPFSSIFLTQFSTLSSLFPQIKHLMVEQSSVMPSVYSRYGVHSVPSLEIVHQTKPTRYHGQKDLHSVIDFYKITTGLKPLFDMVEAERSNSGCDPNSVPLWDRAFLKEAYLGERYLLLSVVFVLSRAFFYFFPGISSCMIVVWMAFISRLNIGILGDSRQLLGRVLHLIDVKRIFCKLNLCKTRNFQRGARNARIWASSLA